MGVRALLQRFPFKTRLTARLTLLYALVSLAILLGMGLAVARAMHLHFVELDDEALHGQVHALEAIVATSVSLADLQRRLTDALLGQDGMSAVLRDRQGTTLFASSGLPAAAAAPHAASSHPQALHDTAGAYRMLQGQAANPELPGAPFTIALTLDTARHAHFYDTMQNLLLLYTALATALAGLLGWWAARTGLAPLRAMKARAQAVTAQRLDERMPVASVPVEMADLAASLNDMLDRLQRDFTRLSEFSSDLAHELRTPLSNLLTQTQVALTQTRDAAAYRDILASNAEELQRLARMVADMLLLARAEHGLLLPTREKIDVARAAQALLEFYDAVADDRQLRLVVSGQGSVEGDRLMLQRALGNLLSNAVRHATPGSTVSIDISPAGNGLDLAISNAGPDIDATLLPRLFDRFFRADKSRQHPDNEGTGLGLAIVRAIALAHGGTVSVSSAAGQTRFTLHLPRAA